MSPHSRTSAKSGRRKLTIAVAAVILLASTLSAIWLNGNDGGAQQAGTSPEVRSSTGTSTSDPQSPDFIRDGKDVSPFRTLIGSDADWAGTPLRPDGNVNHPALSVTPADVDATGDGRKVTWTGNGAGQFYVQNPQGGLDARPLLKSGTLTFDVVLIKVPAAQVSLAMHCRYPCQAPLNATGLFKQLSAGQKTTVRIPLECFVAGGLDPSNVDVPFLLHTTELFEATFTRLRWESAGTASGASVTPCASLH